MLSFDIRYGLVPSREIYNAVGPWDWRDSDSKKDAGKTLIDKVEKTKPGFYQNLEKSILSTGIRNPILVVTGKLPGWQWDQLPEFAKQSAVWCNQWGGSRLFVAQKHSLLVPCLISDFEKKYQHLEHITNGNRIRELLDIDIKKILFTKRGLIIKVETCE
jgi:hypothetical protein